MVDETDFRNLKLGQEAKVKVEALEGLELKGEVTEIGASALVRGSGSQATRRPRRAPTPATSRRTSRSRSRSRTRPRTCVRA